MTMLRMRGTLPPLAHTF